MQPKTRSMAVPCSGSVSISIPSITVAKIFDFIGGEPNDTEQREERQHRSQREERAWEKLRSNFELSIEMGPNQGYQGPVVLWGSNQTSVSPLHVIRAASVMSIENLCDTEATVLQASL